MSNISNLEDYRTPASSTKNSKFINARKDKDIREKVITAKRARLG